MYLSLLQMCQTAFVTYFSSSVVGVEPIYYNYLLHRLIYNKCLFPLILMIIVEWQEDPWHRYNQRPLFRCGRRKTGLISPRSSYLIQFKFTFHLKNQGSRVWMKTEEVQNPHCHVRYQKSFYCRVVFCTYKVFVTVLWYVGRFLVSNDLGSHIFCWCWC